MGKRGKRLMCDTLNDLALNVPEQDVDYRYYYNFYFKRLMEIAISMIHWKNLPDSIDERYLEMTLFTDGAAILFKDDVVEKFLGLQVAYAGELDVYNNPIQRQAFASNGYQNNDLNPNNSVIVWNDYIHSNMMWATKIYASRLAKTEITINANLTAQHTPILIDAPFNMKQQLQQAYRDYRSGAPVMAFTKEIDRQVGKQPIQVLKTDAPYLVDKLYEFKTNTWNDALTFYGVSNLTIHKKERVLRDEVLRSMGGTEAQKYTKLCARQQAAEEFNKMFNENIEPVYRSDIPDSLTSVPFGGGDEIGNLYD